MRSLFAILLLLFSVPFVLGQKPDEVLATATGHQIKGSDLPPTLQERIASLPDAIGKTRSGTLEQMIFEMVIDAEAKVKGTTPDKIIAAEKAKVAAPSEEEIKSIYEANKAELGGRTLEQMRKQIVAFIRSGPEQTLIDKLYTSLKKKFNVVKGKDVNSAGLLPTDVVATVNGKAITASQFDTAVREPLYELRAGLAEAVLDQVDEKLTNALIIDEARSLNIDASAYIAREVSDKMKEFSDDERDALLDAMHEKLFSKYKAKIIFEAPVPTKLNISVDDDPASGPVTAPVTIVMFSDFQCSACSATHPLLKKAMAMFPGKIRFVVRDFPLESIHENGFKAALAAGAANLQGKFFEYTEVLYSHQETLDAASLKRYAVEIGLNAKQFELDFNSEKIAAEVRRDMADGNGYGINSTPTIFINGIKVRDLSVRGFKAEIERALKK